MLTNAAAEIFNMNNNITTCQLRTVSLPSPAASLTVATGRLTVVTVSEAARETETGEQSLLAGPEGKHEDVSFCSPLTRKHCPCVHVFVQGGHQYQEPDTELGTGPGTSR